MTFVGLVIAVCDRFLREQTFDLVVAPAIADLQYDAPSVSRARHARNCLAVLSSMMWGLYEELTSDASSAVTFAMLVLIPAGYYTALAAASSPYGADVFSTTEQRLAIGGLIAVLSLGPAIVCYWPERQSREAPADKP